MARSQLEGDCRDLPDDHWIFEELGSPVKPRRKELSCSDDRGASAKVAQKSEFDGKLQIYANNMRKLILTARRRINTLLQENTMLKEKLESSGLTECPACLYRFKPQKQQKILPKYIKVFRGRLSLEIEFSTLDEMNHWLTANQLDLNSDGLPTVVQNNTKKTDLTTSGSLLPLLVRQGQQSESKKERMVISTRPRNTKYSDDASAAESINAASSRHSRLSSGFEKVHETAYESNHVSESTKRSHDDCSRRHTGSKGANERSLRTVPTDEDWANPRISTELGTEERKYEEGKEGAHWPSETVSSRIENDVKRRELAKKDGNISVTERYISGRYHRSPKKAPRRGSESIERSTAQFGWHSSGEKENGLENKEAFIMSRRSDQNFNRKSDQEEKRSLEKLPRDYSLTARSNRERNERRQHEVVHSRMKSVGESVHSNKKCSRSRESPRKRERGEIPQDFSSTKRLCTSRHSTRKDRYRHDLYRKKPEPSIVEDITADEDESAISDSDLVILDEEEVEDGEILE